jgi:hypothetical protein
MNELRLRFTVTIRGNMAPLQAVADRAMSFVGGRGDGVRRMAGATAFAEKDDV